MNFRHIFNFSSYLLVFDFFNSSINVYLPRTSPRVTLQNESDAGAVSPGDWINGEPTLVLACVGSRRTITH